MATSGYEDPETGLPKHSNAYLNQENFLFDTKQIRMRFIRKVYTILGIQLLLTIGIVAMFALHPGVNLWAKQNHWFVMAAFAVSFIMMLVIACGEKLRRKFPHNLILLFFFTVAESLMLGALTVAFDTKTLFLAGAMTTGVVLALTLFAIQTKIDFTVFNGIMIVVGMVFFLTALIAMFFPPSKPMVLIISSIGALIVSCYLVIDTQMIVGGTHSVQISPEEYVFAALNLYLDIINLFIYILTILSASRD